MITLTDAAKEKIIDIMADEQTPLLRFGLRGGGCSGFEYVFTIEFIQQEDDIVHEIDDVRKILIDPASAMYLNGTEIDFKSGIFDQSFVFNNPNIVASCGCGHSVTF